MINIRQSEDYSRFMEKLGWYVEKIPNYVYVRTFPIIGSFIKVLRIKPPLPFKEIEKIAKKHRAFKVQIELDADSNWTNKSNLSNWSHGYQLANSPLAPTKTILIDLKPKEDEIFNSFNPEKRRAIRRAIKNNIVVNESDNIQSFIDLKNFQLWPFGFLLSQEIKKLWEVFKPAKKAVLLLAFTPPVCEGWDCDGDKPRAGVLLLFHDDVAYYWLASSSTEGKTLFAPSVLVWEALKLSKKKGCTVFDFEGVEDTRFPETKSWKGFSKFKNGFGGKDITFAAPIQKLFWPIR